MTDPGQDPVGAPNHQISLEERRLNIEEAKLEIERIRASLDGRFFARHMGEVIAGSIALVGVIVSAASVWSASIQKDRELQQQSIQKDRELEQQRMSEKGRVDLQRAQSALRDRADERDYRYKWKSDMMQFVERHSNEIFSDDTAQILRMQQVMLAAFPPDDVRELFARLQVTAKSPAAKESWQEAGTQVRRVRVAGAKQSIAVKGIATTVKQIIREQLGLKQADIKLSANLVDDLGGDSLGLVELCLALKEAFAIDIPDEDAERLRTVGDVIKYIESRPRSAQPNSGK